jgi:hypothetical protein
MSLTRKFWKKRQNAGDNGRLGARGREFYGAKLAVPYVTHFIIRIMLS